MSSLLLPTKRLALAPAIGEAAQAETTTAEAEADLWIGRVLRAAAAVEAEGSAEEDEIAPLGPPSPSLLLLHREKRLPSPDDAEEALLLLLWLPLLLPPLLLPLLLALPRGQLPPPRCLAGRWPETSTPQSAHARS